MSLLLGYDSVTQYGTGSIFSFLVGSYIAKAPVSRLCQLSPPGSLPTPTLKNIQTKGRVDSEVSLPFGIGI